MLISTQTINEMGRQLQMTFDVAFREASTFWARKAERIDTASEVNIYSWVSDMPEWREWIGPRLMRNLVARDYKLKNKDYEFSFAVPRNDVFYDRLGVWSRRATIAGRGAKRLYDKLITDAQIAGNTTKCWDGQFFYDTDHPVNYDDAGAGVFANSYVSRPLTLDNLNFGVESFGNFVSDNGINLELVPDILEVPLGLQGAAKKALNAQLIAEAIKNVAGAENVGGAAVDAIRLATPDLIVNPRLPAGVWYLHSTAILKPFVLQVAKDPTALLAKDQPTDHNVFHYKTFEYGSDAIAVAGYTLPQLSIRFKVAA